MMRKYLAAGALGASLLGLGVAGAPLASAHETHPGSVTAAAQGQQGFGGDRRGDPRDARTGAADARTGLDDRGCDHDGQDTIDPAAVDVAPDDVAPDDVAPVPSTPAVDPTTVSTDEAAPTVVSTSEGRRHNPWQILGTTLGMSGDEIRTALRAGQSIDDLAVAQGIDPAVLHDALTQPFDSRLDALVAEGRLTQEQADQVKARFDAFVSHITAMHLTPEAVDQPAA